MGDPSRGALILGRKIADILPESVTDACVKALASVFVGGAAESLEFSISRRREMRQLGFEKLVGSRHSPERDLVVAMVVARILEPQSKLATSQWWHTTTLPEILGVSDAREDDLYAAMDWVLKRQEVIEKKLAARHLHNDGLALYDLTSELLC